MKTALQNMIHLQMKQNKKMGFRVHRTFPVSETTSQLMHQGTLHISKKETGNLQTFLTPKSPITEHSFPTMQQPLMMHHEIQQTAVV
jgi:hypothetical protein